MLLCNFAESSNNSSSRSGKSSSSRAHTRMICGLALLILAAPCSAGTTTNRGGHQDDLCKWGKLRGQRHTPSKTSFLGSKQGGQKHFASDYQSRGKDKGSQAIEQAHQQSSALVTKPSFRDLRVASWNCWGLSHSRLQYFCKLGYDIGALTELHGQEQGLCGERLITAAKPLANDPASD